MAATERHRRWREQNREHHLAYMRERMRQRMARRRDPDSREYAALITGDPCAYCGGKMETVDHVVPVARGGQDSWENFAPACGPCNRQKHAKSLLTFLLDRSAS